MSMYTYEETSKKGMIQRMKITPITDPHHKRNLNRDVTNRLPLSRRALTFIGSHPGENVPWFDWHQDLSNFVLQNRNGKGMGLIADTPYFLPESTVNPAVQVSFSPQELQPDLWLKLPPLLMPPRMRILVPGLPQ